jgi:DNA-binding NtrC family response regulator
MPTSQRRGSILLIDDEDLVRSVLARVLRCDYVVASVPCIVTARELLQRSPLFTLVVCDELVGSDRGSAFQEALRRTGDPTSERMLFMTGGPDVDHLRRLGGGHVLRKPFAARDLVEVVSARIEQLGLALAPPRSPGYV